ncbi:MAG: hypoxanthine phosphoribosyltransferase [Deltaproteobacteria bacterium]|nr:MAG: hypoxanthine phosphoribosyltransferase [Deltaproteobacteria bacterium]
MEHMVERVLISRGCLSKRIRTLAREIVRDYRRAESIQAIAILKGAAIFSADLIRTIFDLNGPPMGIDFIRASSYRAETESSGKVEILDALTDNIAGKDVLIIEDIIDTGLTLNDIKNYILRHQGVKSLRICSLLDKPSRRKQPIEIDYIGFEVPNYFVAGYGTDYAEHFRNLPFVVVLKPSILEGKS